MIYAAIGRLFVLGLAAVAAGYGVSFAYIWARLILWHYFGY